MSKKPLAVIGGIVAVLVLTAGCADNGMFGGGTEVAYGEEVTLEQNSGSSRFTVKVDEPRAADYDASEEGVIALAVDIEASEEEGDYTVRYKSPLKSEDVAATWSKSE